MIDMNTTVATPLSTQDQQWAGGLMKAAITGYVAKQMLKRNPYLPTILMAVQRGITTMNQTKQGVDVDMMNLSAIQAMAAQQHNVQAQQLDATPVTDDNVSTKALAELTARADATDAKLDAVLDKLNNLK